MEKNILKKSGNGYWSINSTSLKGDILINFLRSDVSSCSSGWIEWLNNSQYQFTSSNLTYLEKKDDDIIELSDLFSEEGPFLAIKKSKLIEILEQWELLTKQRPHYIVIILDGDDIRMEGTNNIDFSEQSFVAVRKDNAYYLKKSCSPLGWLWWKFLDRDVNGEVDRWLAWFNDPQQREIVESKYDTCARITKKGSDVLFGEMHTPDGPEYVFKQDNMIEVLKKWDELTKHGVPYIALTIHDNYVCIEGKTYIEED